MQVTFFSAHHYDQQSFETVRKTFFSDFDLTFKFHQSALTNATVKMAAQSDAVCVFVNDHLDAHIIDQLVDLNVKAILLRCTGFNNVDLNEADRLGLLVAHVPAYSPEAVAEHALALVMTLNRSIHRAYNRIREGNFSLDGLLGFNLHGKTVGLIGTGHIGLATARIFKGLGCELLAYDPFPSEAFKTMGQYVELSELLARSDIISLHCPLLEDTYHLINSETIAQMKQNVMLINTSRGGLIDTQAVISALKTHKIGGLAIDVYEQEEPLFFHDRSEHGIEDDIFVRLMSFPNVLITGHQGFFTQEALNEIAHITLNNFLSIMNQENCPNQLHGSTD